MPGTSSRFPPGQRNTFIRAVNARGTLKGLVHFPDAGGDLTNATLSSQIHVLSGFVWDTLGLLDIIDQQQVLADSKIASLQQQLNTITDKLTNLTNILGPLAQIAQSLGVTVPDWRNKADVENGRPDMVDVLSAAQAGLRVTFNVVQDNGLPHGEIISMEPAVGTFVAKGTEVLITINDE